MSDNTTLPPGAGGDTIRTIDRAGIKTQLLALDVGGEAGPESIVTPANRLPVAVGKVGAAGAPASVAVGAVDSIILAANPARSGLVIINTGSVNVSFGLGQAAVLGNGITLTPNGTWVMDAYTYTAAAIHAICSGSSTLSVQEYS